MASTYDPRGDAQPVQPAPVIKVTELMTIGTRWASHYFGGGREGARSWLFTTAFWVGLVLPFTAVGPDNQRETVMAAVVAGLLLVLWPRLGWEPGTRSSATWWFTAASLAFFATAGIGYSSFMFVVVLAQLAMTWLGQPSRAAAPTLALNDRELAVARLVGQGLSNREIGAELFLAEGTVKNTVSNVLRRTGLRDRTQLALALRD